ncbi:MAG: SpoIIE family protein phosphatase, partial [Bacteroidales bacterium]|nr:SpoIIE family protein phosphatase [Bacteroidales bacterium]
DQTENHDGMDMALCSIDKKRNVVEFTGAKNPLIYISAEGELVTIKADKQGIGGDQIEEDFHYTKNEIPIQPGTWYYMFSDGYQDQFGGPQHRKFMIKHMRELLLEIHTLPAAEQREILNTRIEQWMKDGNTEQTDDILVIGFKL